MSVDIKSKVFIDRPRTDVASIMFDPKCDRIWIGGLINVFPMTPGILKTGAKVERVGDFLSKRFSAMVVVTRDEPNEMVELSINEPFEMKVRYELADNESGTAVSIRLQSIGDIDFQLPPALMQESVSKKINGDLERLKKHVETIFS